MTAVQISVSILSLIAGIGVFTVACSMMSSNLESLGSGKLKKLFAKTSGSKLVGVGVGAVTTAAIQSSSAATVMVIGFVNAGIMTLAQAAAVIFGANIGTTITGQIVALGLFGGETVSASVIFAAITGFGAFIITLSKKDRARKIGGILTGFGMIFVGLTLMGNAMTDFANSDSLRSFLAAVTHPLLLVVTGALLTAVIQSSSVMTSIAITMVVTGLISLEQGIYITMGSNVGTCVTALLAGLSGSRNAKRAALIHIIFNVCGVIIFLIIGAFMRLGGLNFGWVFAKLFPDAPQTQLAMFHTVFNLATVAIMLPFTNLLVKFVTVVVKDKERKNRSADDDTALRFHCIDENMLAAPPIAVRQTKKEIIGMAAIAIRNFDIACSVISGFDRTDIDEFRANEKELDFLQKELCRFSVKLSGAKLDEADRIFLSTAIRSACDLERVGDYAENIVEYADELENTGVKISDEAAVELECLRMTVMSLYEKAITAYADLDTEALAQAHGIEDDIDEITRKMTRNHIERLADGKCTPLAGAEFLSLSSDVERIADHFINVANTVKEFDCKPRAAAL